jgi:hypothetical protein
MRSTTATIKGIKNSTRYVNAKITIPAITIVAAILTRTVINTPSYVLYNFFDLFNSAEFMYNGTMTKKPWFRGKRYGYGWGLPTGKEGWLVLLSYLLLVFTASFQLDHTTAGMRAFLFVLQVILATILLFVICYISGEKKQ